MLVSSLSLSDGSVRLSKTAAMYSAVLCHADDKGRRRSVVTILTKPTFDSRIDCKPQLFLGHPSPFLWDTYRLFPINTLSYSLFSPVPSCPKMLSQTDPFVPQLSTLNPNISKLMDNIVSFSPVLWASSPLTQY